MLPLPFKHHWFTFLVQNVVEEVWCDENYDLYDSPPDENCSPQFYLHEHLITFLGAYTNSKLVKTLRCLPIYQHSNQYALWLLAHWTHLCASSSIRYRKQPSPFQSSVDAIAILLIFFGKHKLGIELLNCDTHNPYTFYHCARMKNQGSRILMRLVNRKVFPSDRFHAHPAIRGATDLLTTKVLCDSAKQLLKNTTAVNEETLSAMQRRLNQYKHILLDTAIATAWADGKLHHHERNALREQIIHASLPSPETSALLQKLTDKHKPQPTAAIDFFKHHHALLQDPQIQSIVIATAIISSFFDGYQQKEEKKLIEYMCHELGTDISLAETIELNLLALLEEHPLALRSRTGWLLKHFQSQMIKKLTFTIEQNKDRLIQEIRETGDLSILLSRMARGQKLSEDEKSRMLEQLLDIAKVIPSLAVLALPGGIVMLGILLKVLPFSLLPSSFNHKDPPSS